MLNSMHVQRKKERNLELMKKDNNGEMKYVYMNTRMEITDKKPNQ